MGKYKYESYDYSKVGIKEKVCFSHEFTQRDYELLGTLFNARGEELVNALLSQLKNSYTNVKSKFNKKNYKIDDFNWEWEIITPERTYKSNETSS
jgi:hypothetical protein